MKLSIFTIADQRWPLIAEIGECLARQAKTGRYSRGAIMSTSWPKQNTQNGGPARHETGVLKVR